MLIRFSTVIADTSCFILLDKIGELELLQKVFGEVVTTAEVAAEFGKALPGWIQVEAAVNMQYKLLLEMEVDTGEASAMALGIEKKEAILVLDDLQARKVAEKLKLPFTGTLGLLAGAKRAGTKD